MSFFSTGTGLYSAWKNILLLGGIGCLSHMVGQQFSPSLEHGMFDVLWNWTRELPSQGEHLLEGVQR